MGIPKLSFEDSLVQNVVSTGRCVGCAACVVVCPFKCLEYVGERPILAKKCEVCGICPQVCPKLDLSSSEAEEALFGRHRREDEDFGICRRLTLARTTEKVWSANCQDGGAVAGLLAYALETGIIDGAALSGISEDKPLYPVPTLATTPREVWEHAGTRYAYSPNLLAYHEGVTQRRKSLAFVGTPCQIHAIRRIQMVPLRKYTNPLRLVIGLMCTESFTYAGLFEEYMNKALGIDLASIAKMNIKGQILVQLSSGETKTIPLAEAKKYTRRSCTTCHDFSAELADLSAGGLGLDGWTFIILRTEQGERIFGEAVKAGALETRPVDEAPRSLALLTKLSKKKRRNPSTG